MQRNIVPPERSVKLHTETTYAKKTTTKRNTENNTATDGNDIASERKYSTRQGRTKLPEINSK